MAYSYEEIRSVALDVLSNREQSQIQPSQYVNLRVAIAAVLERRAGNPFAGHQPDLDRADREIYMEVFWDLFRQGILTLGLNDSNPNFPFCRVSHLGRRILDGANPYIFHDVSSYTEVIKSAVPDLDTVTLLYLQEAMQAFRSGCLLSATVMIGVATEHTFELLLEAIQSREPFAETFATVFKQRTSLQRITKFKNILDQNLQLVPDDIREDFETHFAAILSVIRTSRNQAGHPTGTVVSREQAYVLLQLFVPYCKKVYELRKHVRSSTHTPSRRTSEE